MRSKTGMETHSKKSPKPYVDKSSSLLFIYLIDLLYSLIIVSDKFKNHHYRLVTKNTQQKKKKELIENANCALDLKQCRKIKKYGM